MVRLSFVVGGGKLVRQKYSDVLHSVSGQSGRRARSSATPGPAQALLWCADAHWLPGGVSGGADGSLFVPAFTAGQQRDNRAGISWKVQVPARHEQEFEICSRVPKIVRRGRRSAHVCAKGSKEPHPRCRQQLQERRRRRQRRQQQRLRTSCSAAPRV